VSLKRYELISLQATEPWNRDCEPGRDERVRIGYRSRSNIGAESARNWRNGLTRSESITYVWSGEMRMHDRPAQTIGNLEAPSRFWALFHNPTRPHFD